MTPDGQNCTELCEPFVQALEYGKDCFMSMVLNAKYMYAVLNKFHLREWSNYAKWATEGVFEYIRRKEFPNLVSRINCVFYYADIEYSKKLYNEAFADEPENERKKLRLFKVEVDETQSDKRDMSLYDAAYDALCENQDMNAVMGFARKYYSGEHSEAPVWEYLSPVNSKILQDITFVLRETDK